MPYEGVPAALEEFDAVGLNRVFRWLCEAVFAICDDDAVGLNATVSKVVMAPV